MTFSGHITYRKYSNFKKKKKKKKFFSDLLELLNIPTNIDKVLRTSQKVDLLECTYVPNPSIYIGVAFSKRLKYHKFIILKEKFTSYKKKIVGYTRHTCNVYLIGFKFIRGFENFKFLNGYLIHKYNYFSLYTI